MKDKLIFVGLLALGGLLFGGQASAVIITKDCTTAQQNDIAVSDDCVYIANQDGKALNDKAAVLNAVTAFGVNTWGFQDKADAPSNVGTNNLLTLTGNGGSSGTWDLDDTLVDLATKIVLVLKDGNNVAEPPGPPGKGFFAYLLDVTDDSPSNGTWTTADTFGGAGLSHMTAYAITGDVPPNPDPDPIPAPATLMLMGIGFVGSRVALRFRKA